MCNEIHRLNQNLTEYRHLILEKQNKLEQLVTENQRLNANFDAFYNRAEIEHLKIKDDLKKFKENCQHLFDEK